MYRLRRLSNFNKCNIISIMSLPSLPLYYQPHSLHTPSVFVAGGDDINSRGVDAGVAQNIGKLGDIPFNLIKNSRKEMPQIVRKDLLRIDICRPAQRLHLTPNIGAAHRLAASCNENRTVRNFLLCCKAE